MPDTAFKVSEQRGVASVRVLEVFVKVAHGAHCTMGVPARRARNKRHKGMETLQKGPGSGKERKSEEVRVKVGCVCHSSADGCR